MKALAKGTIELTEENKKYFNVNGMKMTGETLTLGNSNGSSCTYVVFKGSRTPYGYVRDCGDHYIKAQYSRYDRIDKETLEITKDVEDI
jgi:hypothetical protein